MSNYSENTHFREWVVVPKTKAIKPNDWSSKMAARVWQANKTETVLKPVRFTSISSCVRPSEPLTQPKDEASAGRMGASCRSQKWPSGESARTPLIVRLELGIYFFIKKADDYPIYKTIDISDIHMDIHTYVHMHVSCLCWSYLTVVTQLQTIRNANCISANHFELNKTMYTS